MGARRFRRFQLWLWLMLIVGVGCAGRPATQEALPSAPPAVAISPAATTERPATRTPSAGEGLRKLEAAIQRGDWEAALAAYEEAGRPVLSADLLNRAMAQGIYMAHKAQTAQEADRQIRGALRWVREACQCLDPQGQVIASRIPEGFRDEFYFYLALADSDALRWFEEEKRNQVIAGDSLAAAVVGRIAQRGTTFGSKVEDVLRMPVEVCPIADRVFLVAGFRIFDLQGPFQDTMPGLSEEERSHPITFDIFCADRKIEWVHAPGAGPGVAIEVEWDGQGFRLVEVTRANLALETYQKVRQYVEAGELEKALEEYRLGFTQQVETDVELATLALRRGLDVANQRMSQSDVAGARRVMHAALSLAAVPYGLEDDTFLPLGWAERPRTLQEWARENPAADPKLYRDALMSYAAYLTQDQRSAEAEPILRGLVVLDPEYPFAYLYLGDALWNQGKTEEARSVYQRFLELAQRRAWSVPDRVFKRLR